MSSPLTLIATITALPGHADVLEVRPAPAGAAQPG